MITIRRLYIYLVCLISLQSIVAALNAVLGGLIRWLTQADPPEALFLTGQLAVLIVGTPIFLGHWAWALGLARDEAERTALSRRLYLHLTQAIAVGYLAYAVYVGVEAVLGLALAGLGMDRYTLTTTERLGALINGIMTLGVAAALWLYHQRLITDRRLPRDLSYRLLFQLYTLAFCGLGLLFAVTSLVEALIEVFGWLNGRAPALAAPLARLAAALPVWAYHEWARARAAELRDAASDWWRWLYATAVSAISLVAAGAGLADAGHWLFLRLAGEGDPTLPAGLAFFVANLPGLAYHEAAAGRVMRPEQRPLRWLYNLGAAGIGLLFGVAGVVAALSWGFAALAGEAPLVNDLLGWGLPGLAIWAYHQWGMRQTGRALGMEAAEAGPLRAEGRMVRRLYVFFFSGIGVSLTALGLIGLQEWLYARFSGETVVTGWPLALAWLVVGVPLWLAFWLTAERRFAGPLADERQSDLRKFYLYLIIYIAVNAAIITSTLLLNGVLRQLLGLPTTGSLGLALGIILAALALWGYHGLVLRADIARVGATSLQAGLQRLYWYLVAALGLAALLVGAAGVLSVLIRWLALGLQADVEVRELGAAFTAALIAGLPVWALSWWPAQRAAWAPGPEGAEARRSLLRKGYLYLFALIAVLMTLGFAITAVFQMLNALVGLFTGANLWAEIAQSIGFTVIATVVWLFHGWVLRGDGRREAVDRQAEAGAQAQAQGEAARALASRWQTFPIAVLDEGDGVFAGQALAALGVALPHLRLIPIPLSAAAAAALGAPVAAADDARLLEARLLLLRWPALAAHPMVRALPTPKVVVPVDTPDLHWATAGASQAEHLVAAVKRLLPAAPPPPPQTP